MITYKIKEMHDGFIELIAAERFSHSLAWISIVVIIMISVLCLVGLGCIFQEQFLEISNATKRLCAVNAISHCFKDYYKLQAICSFINTLKITADGYHNEILRKNREFLEQSREQLVSVKDSISEILSTLEESVDAQNLGEVSTAASLYFGNTIVQQHGYRYILRSPCKYVDKEKIESNFRKSTRNLNNALDIVTQYLKELDAKLDTQNVLAIVAPLELVEQKYARAPISFEDLYKTSELLSLERAQNAFTNCSETCKNTFRENKPYTPKALDLKINTHTELKNITTCATENSRRSLCQLFEMDFDMCFGILDNVIGKSKSYKKLFFNVAHNDISNCVRFYLTMRLHTFKYVTSMSLDIVKSRGLMVASQARALTESDIIANLDTLRDIFTRGDFNAQHVRRAVANLEQCVEIFDRNKENSTWTEVRELLVLSRKTLDVSNVLGGEKVEKLLKYQAAKANAKVSSVLAEYSQSAKEWVIVSRIEFS